MREITDISLIIAQDALWSGLAALGFAILFNVPHKQLGYCVLTGAIGHGLRTFLIEFEVTIQVGTLIGATTVGFLSHYFAIREKMPSTTFSIPGVIPMVPGFFAYQTMIGLLTIANAVPESGNEVLTGAVINAVKTALILAGIAVGIAAPKLLFYRPKPVV